MKATEIMAKYNITRQTLCTWVKEHKINYIKLPNGRYDYSDLKADTRDENLIEDNTAAGDVLTKLAQLQQQVNALKKSQQIFKQLLQFLAQINFMGPELLNQLQTIIADSEKESS